MTDVEDTALLAEDDAARQRALDVDGSFLVQAPAGSGKTELLIQRYLALLATVDDPSQIVALTFTRKAAGEMRERVLGALIDADRNAPHADRDHARLTRTLALGALQQDARHGWRLVEHPSRLRMLTFDALAASLARRAPLAARLGPHAGYVDDATALYRDAAERAIASARADDPDWRLLLSHLDNQAPQIARQIAAMLARRDQWLRVVIDESPDAMRAQLEQAVRDEIVEVLADTHGAFPAGSAADIERCAREAAAVLDRVGDQCELARELEALADAGGLPAPAVEALPLWRTLARFLLVKSAPAFRRKFTRADGIEPVGSGIGAQARRDRRDAIESLSAALREVPGLAGALAAASRMPEPRIADEAWRVVEALLHILPRAAAELTDVFSRERHVDFVQANLAALDALGDAEAPSDLLLQLDAAVRHLLIDEFQDTSLLQLRLVGRLTAGWSPGDRRTIFVVGDPMQSIYRFREAEVAFFLHAQKERSIGALVVEPLALRRNFRSQANIVAWCNDVFDVVLGRVRDPARGVVPFEPAAAVEPGCEGVAPTVELFEDAADEAARVVALVRDAQGAGARDVAVLVRARAHLAAVLPALRRAQIPFTAVELDRLSQRQAVRDLTALTHALVQPADRAAWLAVLRAPWCGLVLADLVAIATAADADRSRLLPRVVAEAEAVPGLSDDGRARLERIAGPLQLALHARGRASVVDRVRGVWLALGGPACLDEPLDLDTATLFFELLAVHERAGDVPDWDAFVGALDTLHASPATRASGGVQVMTMHRAKGLEFDTVILAGLAEEAKTPGTPLLRWRRRRAGLLIAPAKSRGGDTDPLYRYLSRLEAEEEDAELGRLLYVACTRARTRLHLLAAPGTRVDRETGALRWREAPEGSSLAKLAAALPAQLPFVPSRSTRDAATSPGAPPLRRGPIEAEPVAPEPAIEATAPQRSPDAVSPPFDWARETTRRIGTIAHRLLARIADDGVAAWPRARIDALEPRVRADLAAAGFMADELPRAAERVLEAVRRTLDDRRGRWLFDARHADARSEWAIAGVDCGAIVHVVIDRTFVAEGVRWIVDFKTGAHEGGDASGFLDAEVERYREQLERYGRLMRGLDARPVRLALYYPFVEDGFREIPSSAPAAARADAPKQAQLDLG